MPKSARKKSNSAASSPYGGGGHDAGAKSYNSIFKMNTDLGQHVLKNPGVAQAIVDKADLKQSDVCPTTQQTQPAFCPVTLVRFSRLMLNSSSDCSRSRARNRKLDSQDSRKGEESDRCRTRSSYGGRSDEACARQAGAETTRGASGGCHQD
jgi:hypothetical protein